MIDNAAHHFLKAPGSSNNVLVPQPSDDPRDPLVSSPPTIPESSVQFKDSINCFLQNWTPTWKFFAISNALLSTFVQGFGPLALAPMFGFYIQDFHSTLTDVVQFVGVCILVLGFSNLFW